MDPQQNPINDPIDPLKPHIPEQPPSTVIQPTEPKPPEEPDTEEIEPAAEATPVTPVPVTPAVMYVGDDLSATSEVPQPTPVVSQNMSFGTQKPKIKIPKFVPILAAILLLLGGGYVFAVYIPNRPENVWKTGVNRSGDAIDEIVTKATEQDNIDALENSELAASLDVLVDDGTSGEYNADLAMKFSKSVTDTKLTVDTKGGVTGNIKLSVDVLTEIAEGKTFPDIFVRIVGFKSLGLENYVPGINQYDNKWIYLSADYLQEMYKVEGGEEFKTDEVGNLSAAEISEIAKAITVVSNDYIFTADAEKAVLENREFLGKEDVDGVAMYKYKVGINTENAAEYCSALVDSVLNTAGAKKLMGNPSDTELEESKKSSKEDCATIKEDADKDDNESDEEFEVWIDAKYKLISRMRFADDKEPSKYIDIGQNYTGGDEIPFYVDFSKADDYLSKGRFTITANLATNETKGELVIEGKDENSSVKANATMSIKPYPEELKITRPAGALKYEDVMKQISESTGAPVLGTNTEDAPTSLLDYVSGVDELLR